MISEAEIEAVLKARLGTNPITGLPLIYPNDPAPGTKPFALVEILRLGRKDDTMDGTGTTSRGQFIITIVVAEATFTRAAMVFADTISALFPMGLRLIVPGGKLEVRKPPDIKAGYSSNASWRTPVVVDYEAF